MNAVLITGCNGFIGQKLVKYFNENEVLVIGLDITNPTYKNNLFVFHKMLFDKQLCEELNAYQFDIMYHLAWNGVSSLDKNNNEKQFSNFSITYNALQLAKELNVKKVVIPGSMSEFSCYNKPISGLEEDSPSDLYAATKVAIRKISYYYCIKNNINLNWLLITSIYGATRNDNNLLSACIKSIMNDETFETTKLEQKWDYMYIDDLIRAMYFVGLYGKNNVIYPIGSGEVHELKYYIEKIYSKMKSNKTSGIGKLPYKNAYIDNSIPDTSIMKKDTNFEVEYDFDSGIEKMISEIRRNG